ALLSVVTLGGCHRAHLGRAHGRSAIADFLLCAQLQHLGFGNSGHLGTPRRNPPSFYSVLFFRSGAHFRVVLFAAQSGRFLIGVSWPPGIGVIDADGAALVRRNGSFHISFPARRCRTGRLFFGAKKAGGGLSSETEILQRKFAELLDWE